MVQFIIKLYTNKMEKYMKLLLFIFVISSFLYADDAQMAKLTKKLDIYPGSKAIIQWNRIFSSKRHLKRYKLENLTVEQKKDLKRYLIKHAADSQQPIVPGL